MPELPDIAVYIEALEQRLLGATLESVRLKHPFLLRSFDPPLSALNGRKVERFRRIGKRIAVGFEGDHWLVIHLMIAGRLHWFDAGAKKKGRAVVNWPKAAKYTGRARLDKPRRQADKLLG